MRRRMQDTRWLVAQAGICVAVLVAAVVAALTVHVPTPAGPDTLRLVGSAGQAAAALGSYRMELDFSVRGAGIDLEGSGTADLLATGEGTGEVSLPGGETLRFRSSREHAWLQLPAASPQRLGGKVWIGYPVPDANLSLTQDPLDVLGVLSGGQQVDDLGPDEVRDVATRHYAVELDVEALLRLAQEQSGGALAGGLPPGVEVEGQAELWLDDAGLPRRMSVETKTSGITSTFSFELFDYGVDVDVSAPPAEQVLEVGSQQEAMEFFTNP